MDSEEVIALKELVRESYKACKFARDSIGEHTGKDGNPSLTWIRLNFIVRMIERYSLKKSADGCAEDKPKT